MDFIRKNEERELELVTKEGVPFLQFQSFEKTGLVAHGFSTRMGGVSKNELGAMNLSFSRGDEPERVQENYRLISKAIGFSCENLVLSHQTHTTNVQVVTEKDRGKGFITKRDYEDVDGFVTDAKEVALATFYADCVPLFFLDPIKKAIGLSHSGWKGTVGKIGKVTVEQMVKTYGSKSQDILVAIGPSICQSCYEVSSDVAEAFQEAFTRSQWDEILEDKGNGKFQLDLWRCNEIILEEAGIKRKHISTTNICTCCNPDLLFSHRASGGKRGNLAGFLMLK